MRRDMNTVNKKVFILILSSLILFFPVLPVFCETAVYHGADSVFTADGIVVFWAILKNKSSDSSVVYIAIDRKDDNNKEKKLKSFSLVAVDVFSGEQKLLVQHHPLRSINIIKEDGKSFDEMSKRKILFYEEEKPLKNTEPDMEIFYFGVPDTTPVFLEKSKMEVYFRMALSRLSSKTKVNSSE